MDEGNPAPLPRAGWLHWVAHGLGGLIVAISIWMILGRLSGDSHRATRPLVSGDYSGLAVPGVALAGLVIAWWREATGTTIALLAITIATSLNWRVLVSPLVLIPAAAGMYIACAFCRTGDKLN